MRISVFYLANIFLSALVFSEGTILMPQRVWQAAGRCERQTRAGGGVGDIEGCVAHLQGHRGH